VGYSVKCGPALLRSFATPLFGTGPDPYQVWSRTLFGTGPDPYQVWSRTLFDTGPDPYQVWSRTLFGTGPDPYPGLILYSLSHRDRSLPGLVTYPHQTPTTPTYLTWYHHPLPLSRSLCGLCLRASRCTWRARARPSSRPRECSRRPPGERCPRHRSITLTLTLTLATGRYLIDKSAVDRIASLSIQPQVAEVMRTR